MLSTDIKEFSRRIKLKGFFDQNENHTSEDLVKNRSRFSPQRSDDHALNLCVDNLNRLSTTLLESENTQRRKSCNINFHERKALTDLKRDSSLVIKNADKGGCVVVMDATYYKDKMLELLNDTETYIRVDDKRDYETMKLIKDFVTKYSNMLSESEAKYLTDFEWITSNIYGLPKVHKSNTIKNQVSSTVIHVPRPSDLKFRPIVGGPNCPTSRLSNLVDILLKPFVIKIDSHIADTKDFLRSLPYEIDDDCELVTFDIASLYTNVEKELGVEAIRYWIQTYPELLHPRFTEEFVIEAIELILENNVFFFNDELYLQRSGTAMGTKMAPSYCTLTVAYKELKLRKTVGEEKGEFMAEYIRKNLRRFLDDGFIPWLKRFGDSVYLENKLNDLHPKLTFTFEKSSESISFLDVQVYIEDSKVKTDIFYKPTDSHNFLRFDSCHPRHTKTNIPFGQARRICTIVSDVGKRDTRLNELRSYLTAQKYPLTVIDSGIERAIQIPREELLRPKERNEEKSILPFISTYNPNNTGISSVIKDNLSILKTDDKWKNILERNKFINCYRSPPSLGSLLTRSKFTSCQEIGGAFKCKKSRCGCCKNMEECNQIKFENGFEFHIKSRITCQTKNVIYCLKCAGCNRLYIGQTKMELRFRMTLHRQHINDEDLGRLYVSKHIRECAKTDIPFRVTPFFKMNANATEIERETKERQFIVKFKPSLNSN